MTFAARYPSFCRECGEDIEKGAIARYVGDDLVHDVCPDPMAVVRPLCPDCFLELPVSGEHEC